MSVIPQPASAPASESQPSQPFSAPTAPPSLDNQLKELFDAQYEEPAPTFESALTTSAADLKAAREAAGSEFESVPQLLHSPEQRAAMGGKRYPGLTTVTRLMAEGLAQHPEIVEATLVTPELALTVIAQDDAATDLAVAGHWIGSAADDGSILASATTETLCQRILVQVQQAKKDPRTQQDERSRLEAAFYQPERLQADRLQRLQAAKGQNQQTTQGPAQQADQAQTTAAQSRLVDAFEAAIRKK